MKKYVFIIIFIFFLVQVNGSICQDKIVSGEDCLMVTPQISCLDYSYIVSNDAGFIVESGNLTYYGNNSYYFNWVQGVGDYHVKLCDGTTRDVYVVDGDVKDMSYSITSLYGIVFLFLIIIGLSIFMFFYNNDDVWLQLLSFLLGSVTFIFLIILSLHVNDIQNNYSTGFSRFVVGDTDYNSDNVSYYSLADANHYLLKYDGFNDMDVNKFDMAKLCFKFNNSDEANMLSVYNINSRVSDKHLIGSNLVGEDCFDFKVSKLYNGAFIGIGCDDCSVSNSFGLSIDLDASLVNVNVLNINQSYDILFMNPFLYEIRVRYPPFNAIRDLFFYYVWIMGFFVLAFGSRAIIMYVIKVKEAVEK